MTYNAAQLPAKIAHEIKTLQKQNYQNKKSPSPPMKPKGKSENHAACLTLSLKHLPLGHDGPPKGDKQNEHK